jgi:hypothetical protein
MQVRSRTPHPLGIGRVFCICREPNLWHRYTRPSQLCGLNSTSRPPPRADTQGRSSDPLFSIYPNQNKAPVTLQDVVSQDGRSTEITLGSVQHVIHRRITMDQTETVQSDREKTGATVTIRCP